MWSGPRSSNPGQSGRTGRWRRETDTPAKVAARWVRAIDAQEKNVQHVLTIRYEDLVTEPGPIVRRLGEFLEVDPAGFRPSILRSTSIGKYRQVLGPEDLELVEGIAGETMRRLGYLLVTPDDQSDLSGQDFEGKPGVTVGRTRF